MNEAIKKRWVTALRSGEYKQGRCKLRQGDAFCCLGVLCELAVADGVIERYRKGDAYAYGRDMEQGMPPIAVVEWAGIPHQRQDGQIGRLMGMNDGERRTFFDIANYIEDHL